MLQFVRNRKSPKEPRKVPDLSGRRWFAKAAKDFVSDIYRIKKEEGKKSKRQGYISYNQNSWQLLYWSMSGKCREGLWPGEGAPKAIGWKTLVLVQVLISNFQLFFPMTLQFGFLCQWAPLFQSLLFPACSSVLHPYLLAPDCQSFEVSKRKTQAGPFHVADVSISNHLFHLLDLKAQLWRKVVGKLLECSQRIDMYVLDHTDPLESSKFLRRSLWLVISSIIIDAELYTIPTQLTLQPQTEKTPCRRAEASAFSCIVWPICSIQSFQSIQDVYWKPEYDGLLSQLFV